MVFCKHNGIESSATLNPVKRWSMIVKARHLRMDNIKMGSSNLTRAYIFVVIELKCQKIPLTIFLSILWYNKEPIDEAMDTSYYWCYKRYNK